MSSVFIGPNTANLLTTSQKNPLLGQNIGDSQLSQSGLFAKPALRHFQD